MKYLFDIEGVETPLHLVEEFCTFQCALSLEGHPAFKVEPLYHHEHRNHMPRGEKEMILLFCGWFLRRKEALLFQSLLFELSFSVFWGRTNLKCPPMPGRTGTKDFLGSSGIASRGRKDCPPRCSGILPEMLEIKEKSRRQWSWVTHFLALSLKSKVITDETRYHKP